MPSLPKRRVRWSALVGGLLLLATVLIGAPTAAAEPPSRMDSYVVDSAGVLDGGERDRVQAAVDRLYDDRRVRLWITYVQDFDGLGAEA
ncbi:hypothetical protein ACFYT3_14585 [Nocardia amikacinitolerans]